MNIAIIFAGGSGIRMGAGIPKQFLEINGKPVLIHTLELFQYHMEIDKIYLAIQPQFIPYVNELVTDYRITKLARTVEGGATAQDSIYHALIAAQEENPGDSIVLIHDGVRPFVSYEVISANIAGVHKNGNAITCTPCYETILISHDGDCITDVPYRKETFSGQAPQSFYLKDIISAHKEIQIQNGGYDNMVDACTIMQSLGHPVHMVMGNRGNIKITTPEDVYTFRALLQYKENEQAFGLGLTDKVAARINKFI